MRGPHVRSCMFGVNFCVPAKSERDVCIFKTKQICENKNQKASAELDFNHLLTDKTHLIGSLDSSLHVPDLTLTSTTSSVILGNHDLRL